MLDARFRGHDGWTETASPLDPNSHHRGTKSRAGIEARTLVFGFAFGEPRPAMRTMIGTGDQWLSGSGVRPLPISGKIHHVASARYDFFNHVILTCV